MKKWVCELCTFSQIRSHTYIYIYIYIYIFARITLELFDAEKSIYGNNEDLAIKRMQAAMSDEVGIKENKIRIMGNIFEVLKGIIGKILSVLGSSFIH